MDDSANQGFLRLFLKLPSSFLYFLGFLIGLTHWLLDVYLYNQFSDIFFICIEILLLSIFTILFIILLLYSFLQKGNLFYFGLIISIIAYVLILIPFLGLYLPLYSEAPWGNSLRAETFYLGCFILLIGGFLLNYDISTFNNKIIWKWSKIPETTKFKIINAFLFISGLFLAYNLCDFSGIIWAIYKNYAYVPEPLFLEKVPVLIQFMINLIMICIWLSLFILYLNKSNLFSSNNKQTLYFLLIIILCLIISSILIVLTCKNYGLKLEVIRYIISPIPSLLLVIPLYLIVRIDLKNK